TAAASPAPAGSSSPGGTWAAPTAPGGIPFTEVAAPAPQPQFPDAATAGATVVPPVPELPKTEDIRVPPASLLAANARVRTS
ncbi:plasmid stabilization protein, partial [Streptomyces sp. NPDC001356]